MERRDSTGLTPGEGRKFAFTVGAAFLVLAGVLFWRGHDVVASVPAVLGGSLLLAGLAVPGRLGPVLRAWMGLAHAISRVTTPIFLGIVFYGVLTPTGFLRRAFGGNPVRHVARDGSYWAPRPAERRRSDLHRQF